MDNYFTPFGGRVDPPKPITLRAPPLRTRRIVATLFALCCAFGGWLLNDAVDVVVRAVASIERR